MRLVTAGLVELGSTCLSPTPFLPWPSERSPFKAPRSWQSTNGTEVDAQFPLSNHDLLCTLKPDAANSLIDTVDFKDIQKILNLMEEHDLNSFQLDTKDFKIKLRRGPEGPYIASGPVMSSPAAPAPTPASSPQPAGSGEPAGDSAASAAEGPSITSPMVGTFYRSPSPGADAFVDVGDKIKAGQVVCIVEAMKVMNEIKSDLSGTITEITVEDSTPVQFGETLFVVKPD